MSEGLKKILLQAHDLFMVNGVKSTTMDDLAAALGISKKTLYQTVSNKDELVYKAFELHMEMDKQSIIQICKQSSNAIEEMLEIGKLVTKHMRNINPMVINDVKRYFPEAWDLFNEYKNSFVYEHIVENIGKGTAQGLYRKDVNADVIAKMYASKAECVLDQKLFPFTEYTIISVYNEYLRYHIRGIASEKGMKYMEKLKMN